MPKRDCKWNFSTSLKNNILKDQTNNQSDKNLKDKYTEKKENSYSQKCNLIDNDKNKSTENVKKSSSTI